SARFMTRTSAIERPTARASLVTTAFTRTSPFCKQRIVNAVDGSTPYKYTSSALLGEAGLSTHRRLRQYGRQMVCQCRGALDARAGERRRPARGGGGTARRNESCSRDRSCYIV